jgi:hypothetical protein
MLDWADEYFFQFRKWRSRRSLLARLERCQRQRLERQRPAQEGVKNRLLAGAARGQLYRHGAVQSLRPPG